MKSDISERIAELETAEKRRKSHGQDQALYRLWLVLEVGSCPDLPAFREGDSGRCEKRLLASGDRITAGTEQAADRAVLASLPASKLKEWIDGGISARNFVAMSAQVYQDF